MFATATGLMMLGVARTMIAGSASCVIVIEAGDLIERRDCEEGYNPTTNLKSREYRSIQVVRVEPGQDAGPVQKVVHQRVDGDHGAADLGPEDHLFGSTEQEARQGHGEDLVRDTVDLSTAAMDDLEGKHDVKVYESRFGSTIRIAKFEKTP